MINKLNFDPIEGIQNTASFPNPSTEDETREQLQRLHNQTRDFINDLVNQLNEIGIETAITSEDIKYLRIEKGALEYSDDGNTWYAIGGSGGGGGSLPGGGSLNDLLVRGANEYSGAWKPYESVIGIANALADGLLSKEDKVLLDKLGTLLNNGTGISSDNVQQTEGNVFISQVQKDLLFDNLGNKLFYTASEIDQLFQRKIAYGTAEPETLAEGEIYLVTKEVEA